MKCWSYYFSLSSITEFSCPLPTKSRSVGWWLWRYAFPYFVTTGLFQESSVWAKSLIFTLPRLELSIFSFSFLISDYSIIALKAFRETFWWSKTLSDFLRRSLQSFFAAGELGVLSVNRSSSAIIVDERSALDSQVASQSAEGRWFWEDVSFIWPLGHWLYQFLTQMHCCSHFS